MGDDLGNNWARIISLFTTSRTASMSLIRINTDDKDIIQTILALTGGLFMVHSMCLTGSEANDRAKLVILFNDETAIRVIPIGTCVGGSLTPHREETTTQLDTHPCKDARINNKDRNVAVLFPCHVNDWDKAFDDMCLDFFEKQLRMFDLRGTLV